MVRLTVLSFSRQYEKNLMKERRIRSTHAALCCQNTHTCHTIKMAFYLAGMEVNTSYFIILSYITCLIREM